MTETVVGERGYAACFSDPIQLWKPSGPCYEDPGEGTTEKLTMIERIAFTIPNAFVSGFNQTEVWKSQEAVKSSRSS